MTLRSKILLVFFMSFIALGAVQFVQKMKSLSTILENTTSEVNKSNELIWKKILNATFVNFKFYAFSAEGGSKSIWALRGKRSPISAIESGNKKRIARVLKTFFNNLAQKGILDALIIYDVNGDLIHALHEDRQFKFRDIRHGDLTGKRNNGFLTINGNLYAYFSFNIYSNARVVGTIVYCKLFSDLSSDLKRDTHTDIDTRQISSAMPNTRHRDNALRTNAVRAFRYWDITRIFSDDFAVFSKIYDIGDSQFLFTFRKDISANLKAFKKALVNDFLTIGGFLLAIAVIVVFLLSRGFRPLAKAIESLDKLALGDTSISFADHTRDEVGKITQSVEKLRGTVIEYSEAKKTAQNKSDEHAGKIKEASLSMAQLLPPNIQRKLNAEVGNFETKRKNEDFPDNIFDLGSDNTLELIERIFSSLTEEIVDQFEKEKTLTRSYQRFVPSEILSSLNKTNIIEVSVGNQSRREVSVLFWDIRSFTTIAETLPPDQVFGLLNMLLQKMIPIIGSYGGYVDKFIGDAVMALFVEGAGRSVVCAVEILSELKNINPVIFDEFGVALEIGIGINSGTVVLGTIGTDERMEGTVIGDTVNLAARLESLTKTYSAPLLVSGDTLERATGDLCGGVGNYCRMIDKTTVKGKTEEIEIFEVFDWESADEKLEKLSYKETFMESIKKLNLPGQRSDGERALLELSVRHPNDRVLKSIIETEKLKSRIPV